LAHSHINFVLFWQAYDLLQSLLGVPLDWLISFLPKQCESLKREARDNSLFRLPKNQPLIIYIYNFFSPKVTIRPVTRGNLPAKLFALHGKFCWAQLQTIGHSLKNLGPSQKTLRHPWCPKLVTGLVTIFLNLPYAIRRKFSTERVYIRPVPSPRGGGLGGLNPPNKAASTPKLKYETL